MTHIRSDAHVKYLLQEEFRPQLVSRHSSSLPISHRTEAKKKALSRRSRSASPCVKKTNNSSLTVSGNIAGSPQQRYPAIKATLSGTQVPVIRKSSHVSVKNPKPLRVIVSAGAKPKQRSQILGEPQKFFSSPSVWEHISSVQGELTPYPPSIPADVNCNFPFANRNVTSHWRKVKHSHTPVTPLNELLLDDNVGAVVVTDDYADVKKRKADNEQRSQIATKSLFDANLPPELKLKIFSYLNQREKGQCMFVSTEWNAMIRSPELWQHVNLREFRLCHGHVDDDLASSAYCGQEAAMDTSSFSQCTQQCYGQYINRVDNYISFLIDIQPKVKRLEFSFDLIEDNWIATVNRLKFHLKLNELQYADINWRDTPAKPNYLSSPNQGLNDVMYKTRRRCRKFLDFMEEFVEEAPNLQTLVVPFEWSSRSMKALLSLKKLRNLTIEKYFVFQRPVQEVLNSFGQMQCLERLVLEIWTPSSADMTKYSIISPSLRYLDLSQSRGFYLQSVDLPLLEVFIDERKPWNGPLTFPSQINLPCIGNILQAGAPKLSRVNTSNITTMKSETVEAILKTICPCRHHKSSVTM